MKNLLKKIFKFFRIKYYFIPPKKVDLVIFDRTNANIFFPYLKNIKYRILDIRLESINLYVMLYALIKHNIKFNFFFYIIEYLKFTKCKTIITFIDNNFIFYQIKNYLKLTKLISVQNGLRTSFFFEDLSLKKNLKVDHFFSFNKLYVDKFKNSIDGNYYSTGSFVSNSIPINEKKNNFVNYISSGPDNLKDVIKIYKKKSVDQDKYFEPEIYTMKLLKKFCLLNNLELNILGRASTEAGQINEKKFYTNLFPDFKFNYIKFHHNKNPYSYCDLAQLNVCIYSALGLEILSRFCKTVILNFRADSTNCPDLNIFWPKKISEQGEFWTSKKDEDSILNKFQFIKDLNPEDWQKLIKEKYPDLIGLDPNNKIFSKIIGKTLND